jgi:2'-5' RNA ligase
MDQQLPLFESPRPPAAKYSFFLALFPDPGTARRIVEIGNGLRRKHGMQGKLRPIGHLHISMHGLGHGSEMPDVVVEGLGETCGTVAARTQPFEVKFDRVFSFRNRPGNNPLVLVGNDHGNGPLKKFHQLLELQLVTDRLSPGPNARFEPHITLLYDEKSLPPAPVGSVSWRVEEIVLVRSEVGATKYLRMARWPLGG